MKKIKIDYRQCIGCRHCEVACSLFHVEGIINPRRSRIRVFTEGDFCFPVIAGPFTDAECNSRNVVVIEGEEYDGCLLCRASCPVKPVFKEPDTDIPLKCDFCGVPPDPQCVKWCPSDALTLVEDQE